MSPHNSLPAVPPVPPYRERRDSAQTGGRRASASLNVVLRDTQPPSPPPPRASPRLAPRRTKGDHTALLFLYPSPSPFPSHRNRTAREFSPPPPPPLRTEHRRNLHSTRNISRRSWLKCNLFRSVCVYTGSGSFQPVCEGPSLIHVAGNLRRPF